MQWTSGSELCHHGRPGQKWGVENGPPYPLSRQGFGTTKSYRKVMQNVAKSVGDTVKKKVKQFKSSREEAKKRVLAKKQEKEEAKKRAIEEAKDKERKELVESGDIKRILRNQSVLSEQEIREAISRVKLNQELASLEASRINKGVNAISHVMSNAAKIGDAVENGVKTWNTFAKIANNLTKASFPIIDEKYAKEKAAAAKAGSQVANDLANIGVEGMLKNQTKYTTAQLKDAKERSQTISGLEKAAKAKKNEAEGKAKAEKAKKESEDTGSDKSKTTNTGFEKPKTENSKSEEKSSKSFTNRIQDEEDRYSTAAAKRRREEKRWTEEANETAKYLEEASKRSQNSKESTTSTTSTPKENKSSDLNVVSIGNKAKAVSNFEKVKEERARIRREADIENVANRIKEQRAAQRAADKEDLNRQLSISRQMADERIKELLKKYS